ILGSMILDEVDLVRVAVFPLEGDPPRAIHIHSPSHRLRLHRVKPKSRQLQIIQCLRLMQSVENLDATLGQILTDPAAPTSFEQLLEAFVGQGLNHSCLPSAYASKPAARPPQPCPNVPLLVWLSPASLYCSLPFSRYCSSVKQCFPGVKNGSRLTWYDLGS